MPLITVPSSIDFNNYIGNFRVVKTVSGSTYDSSLFSGDGNSYSSSSLPLIESGIVSTGTNVSSIKSLIAFPINISDPTTLETLYGKDIIINNITLQINGVRSSSFTPEGLDVNFYFVSVPPNVAVEAATEGNPLHPDTVLMYNKKNSYKLGSIKTPIIDNFTVTLDNSLYYYVKDRQYFYLLVEFVDQDYHTPYLDLLSGQERRLISSETACSATVVFNYSVGKPTTTSCGYVLEAPSVYFSQEGGSTLVDIFPYPYGQCLGGTWSISNPTDYPWVSFNTTSGFGPDVSTLQVTVTNNSSDTQRTAVFYINDQVLTINQAGFVSVPCSFYLNEETLGGYTVPLLGGSIVVPIFTTSDCDSGTWTVRSDVPWITFNQTSGTKKDTSFIVYYETSGQRDVAGRRGTVHFNDLSFEVIQDIRVTACTTFSPGFTVKAIPSPASTLVLDIISDSGLCAGTDWTLTSNVSWITVGPRYGLRGGRTVVDLNIAENTGSIGRIGTLTLGPSNYPTITIVQSSLSSSTIPDPPTSVTATLLSNNTTARINIDVGGQTDLSGLYYRVITNGVEGNWKITAYLNPFTVTELQAGNQYYFDVCLIKSGAISLPTRTTVPIQPVVSPPGSGGQGIVGPKDVIATYDSVTDSIVLSWDNSNQTSLTGYKITYYQSTQGIAYSLYVSSTPGNTYTIKDLSIFNKDQYYIFSVALIQNNSVSTYSPSNPIFIPLSYVTGQELKLSPKFFYYSYPDLSSEDYRQITHFVNRQTLGIASNPVTYYTLYKDDYAEAIYSDDAVRSGFVKSYFSLTNSYSDKTTTTTTWNYENRVGVFYFELPENSYIENPYLYLYFSPEEMGIPFDSDGVYLDVYAIPSSLIEEVGDQLRISKQAYTTSIYSPKIADVSSRFKVKDVKTSNPVVLKIPIQVQNGAIFTTESGKKILPIKMGITLPKDFSLPTGYNAISFARYINAPSANNSGVGFAAKISYIDRPVDFRIKPINGDIEIYWSASPSAQVTSYEITATDTVSMSSAYLRVSAETLYNSAPLLLSDVLDSRGMTVNTAHPYSIKMRALTPSNSDSSAYTYSLSALPVTPTATSTLPFPPLNIKAFYGPEKVFVSWDAPSADMEVPVYKFRIYTSRQVGTGADALPVINSYIDENNIKYEKFGIELNNENSGIQNGSIYTFSVSSVNASGESYVQLSTSVLPNEIKRLETVDNNRYKMFYEYPVELLDNATKGQPLYPEFVDGHSSIFGDLVERYDYILASKDVGSTVTFTDVKDVCRIKVWEYTGEDGIFIVNFPEGTYKYPEDVVQVIQGAIDTNILNGEYLPLTVGVANGTRIYIQHTLTTNDPEQVTLELIDSYDSANDLLFGSEPIIASPNVIVKAEDYTPTVEYDRMSKRSLADSRPYRKVVKRFDIVPASKTPTSTTKYPLSFNLNEGKSVMSGGHKVLLTNEYDDIRVGSVTIEWYVNETKETLFDNGDGYLLSVPKVDACGNKVPSQSLGVIDYASGIISCNLPSITSGYVVITYLVNEKVSNPQEYVWMPTPHYILELNMYEPIFFTYPHYAYIMQNQAKLKPGYTVLEYLKINANITSDLSDISSSLNIDIE